MRLAKTFVLLAPAFFLGSVMAVGGCASQTVVRGGSPLLLNERRVGSRDVGTLYLNRTGLGQTGSLHPQTMRISVAQAGDILYQLSFFMVGVRDQLLADFEIRPNVRFNVGGDSSMKGVILSPEAATTHIAVLRGELTVDHDLNAVFTGEVVHAGEPDIALYARWNRTVDNVVLRAGRPEALGPGDAVRITGNVLQ